MLLQFLLLLMFIKWCPFSAGATAPTFNSHAGQPKDFDPTGWELALVTTPSTDISAANDRQLVWRSCGFITNLLICCSLSQADSILGTRLLVLDRMHNLEFSAFSHLIIKWLSFVFFYSHMEQ